MVQGWNLFLHSVLMILRNIPAILRIFLLPLLGVVVLILMIAYFNGQFAQTAIGDDSTLVDKRVDPKQMASVFLTMVMVLLLLFWGVVAWHRYVLLEETPRGWVPFFDRSIFGLYIWRVVLLAMVTLAFGVPFIFLFSAVAASIGMLGLVVIMMN